MTRVRLLVALMAMIVAIIVVAPADIAAQELTPTFTSQAELVVLHVTVKDRRGAYVTDLSKDAFTVFEDERPNPISVFTAVDSPVTVGLIIDSSGSMREGRHHVLAAATAFASASHPQDDLFAVTFNENVRDVLPGTAPFTSDPSVLHAALDRTIRASGRTALYDAIRRGLAYVEDGRHPRRVLVLVADGGDNASAATFEQVLREAQASHAAIYAVGVVDPLDRNANRGRLRDLARATGGEAFFPRRVEEVAKILRHIAEEIRHTYTLGFVPPDVSQDGAFHRLRVEVRGADRRLDVRTREGYRASFARTRRQ
jgi:Ca-activated chloride channel family protein